MEAMTFPPSSFRRKSGRIEKANKHSTWPRLMSVQPARIVTEIDDISDPAQVPQLERLVITRLGSCSGVEDELPLSQVF